MKLRRHHALMCVLPLMLVACVPYKQQNISKAEAEFEVDVFEEPEVVSWYPITKDSIDYPPSYSSSDVALIGNKTYFKNNDGNIVLSEAEIAQLTSQGAKVFHPHPISGIEVDAEEIGALMQDEEALFAYLKNPNYNEPGSVSFVVKQGGLKENLQRLSNKHNISHFRWEVPFNFHVTDTKILKANSFDELLGTMTRTFPIEASVENEGTTSSVLRVYEINNADKNISFVVTKGSLKENFINLSRQAGWEQEWGFDHDFHVPTTQVIRGASYKELLTKMLTIQQYPIVAESTEK